MQATSIDSIPSIVSNLRKSFNTGKTKDVLFRKQQLLQLYRMTQENYDVFAQAVWEDLRKNKHELNITEMGMVGSDIAFTLDNLDKWVAPQYPEVDLVNKFDGCEIHYEPLGVALIIGAWNYPVQLTLVPLIGAIAAGNCAVIKPSEISSHTAQVMAELIPKYLDPECYHVINGGVAETSAVLQQRFDHILYTGNSAIGKIVMKAASQNLTPVTLELGGKSPVIVLDDADAKIAGRRITWGRFLNCGQTCVAPDYILCSKEMQPKLINAIKETLVEFYGENPQKSDSYGRIVNKNHFKRVSSLIEADHVALGGQTDESDLYIAPTVLVNCSRDSPSMRQEIFGPVLPIINISSVEEAISFVNEGGEKPLALYVFGKDYNKMTQVLGAISSGSAVTNDCLVQCSVHSLPFGGVGNSGMGAYHGKLSFETFSHKKSVMRKNEMLESVNNLRYPPYTDKKMNLLKAIIFKAPSTRHFPFIGGVAIVGTAAAAIAYLM